MTEVFAADDVRKSFGPNAVLRGVTLAIEAGKVHALLGENGAGKSTFARVLLGLERPDGGAMRLAGAAYRPRSTAEARRAGVVMVPQERTLCPHLTVAENIVLGVEPSRALGIVRGREARSLAERALALVVGDAARVPASARAGDLSVADQQLVEIARALAQAGVDADGGTSARLLLLDEPTSSLGQDDASRLFARIRALKEKGLAFLLVTHFLADVRDHADRYTVLRDGKVQGDGDPKTTPPETIVHEMLGRELEAAKADTETERRREGARTDVALEVEALAGASKPRRATFAVRGGEIFGVAGLVGSGRTELLRAVLWAEERAAGTVTLRAPRGVGLLSEDRGGEGLMLARSIADNVTLSRAGSPFVRPSASRAEAARWIERLAVRAPGGPDQPAGDLSGGNQQKVQIARLLREDYDVLLVDEPTRGIDVAAKAQVLALLRELAVAGKAIVLVSSQLDELVSTCDRIAVLAGGELGDARPAAEWTEESLLLRASGAAS